MPNSRRHVISCLGVYCLLFELRFDVGSGNLKTSTSPPRGNQVDGLPRAASFRSVACQGPEKDCAQGRSWWAKFWSHLKIKFRQIFS